MYRFAVGHPISDDFLKNTNFKEHTDSLSLITSSPMFLLLSYFELTQKEFEIISKGEVKFSVCVIENKIPYLTIRFTNQTGSIICGVACLSIEQDDDFNAINILLNDSRNKNLLSMRVLGLDAKLISLLQKLIADIKDHKIAFEKATKFQLAYSDEQIEKMAQYSFKIN